MSVTRCHSGTSSRSEGATNTTHTRSSNSADMPPARRSATWATSVARAAAEADIGAGALIGCVTVPSPFAPRAGGDDLRRETVPGRALRLSFGGTA